MDYSLLLKRIKAVMHGMSTAQADFMFGYISLNEYARVTKSEVIKITTLVNSLHEFALISNDQAEELHSMLYKFVSDELCMEEVFN